MGLASGVAWYDFDLPPRASLRIALAHPFHEGSEVAGDDARARLTQAVDRWDRELGRVRLSLPPPAGTLAETFRVMQGYLLTNSDGDGLQPGSRTYKRSWIRDGASIGEALLATGHPEPVRRFIDWYAGYQFPSGKVPCVVDVRGPDPVPEHDSAGEFIYLVGLYHRFTHDRGFLERQFPHVEAAVAYLESLRARRLGAEYRNGPPERRVLMGLLPESISHEGYSAKPMHSYWDDFWALRGLKDAAAIAHDLGRSDLELGWGTLRDDFRATLRDSIGLAAELKGIDYIPGCAELGDFDATSTAVAVCPVEEPGAAPAPLLARTFDRYLEFFRERRSGRVEWRDYTPYELRLVRTFLRLGCPAEARELLGFFIEGQRPAGWRQWAEVVWRDARHPGFIGDMPHTWVGAEFINAVRALVVDERADTILLGAGVPAEWAESEQGVGVEGFPTSRGAVSWSVRRGEPGTLVFEFRGGLEPGPGRIAWVIPDSGRAISIEVDGRRERPPADGWVALEGGPARVVVRY
jgi:hypothetical protein